MSRRMNRPLVFLGFRGIMDRLEALSRRLVHILRICAEVLPREAVSALMAALTRGEILGFVTVCRPLVLWRIKLVRL